MTILKLWCISLSAANKRSRRYVQAILILATLIFSGSNTFAQSLIPLSVEIIEKNQTGQYQIGDRIQLSAALPYEISSQLKSLKIKPEQVEDSTESNAFFLDPSPQVIGGNLRFSISPVKAGKVNLPALIVYKDEDKPIAKTSALSFDVTDLEKPKEEPTLLDPVSVSIPLSFILFALIVLASFISVGFYIYRKYLKKKPVIQPVVEMKIPPVPDHEIAHRDINALYEQHPYSPENLKPVAFGLSQILKNYFSSRFKIDAKEATTSEMLALLRDESIPSPELKRISDLFRKLDQIKFTDYEHHSFFLKGDFIEFKEISKAIVDTWTIRGGNP